jgi:hypothetical protein
LPAIADAPLRGEQIGVSEDGEPPRPKGPPRLRVVK